jgi:hypothetical protein
MNFIGGVVLIAIAVAMVLLARPKDGVSARFLKGLWIVGQVYTLIIMICAVIGVSAIIVNWPS